MTRSRILDAVHETARDLHRAGVLDDDKMRQFDVLCLRPVRKMSAGQIRAIRTRSRMSQAAFAAVLNTSVSTVQKWEIGETRPSGPSLRLLDIVHRKGVESLM